jgi:hypothetical protein
VDLLLGIAGVALLWLALLAVLRFTRPDQRPSAKGSGSCRTSSGWCAGWPPTPLPAGSV